MTPLTGLNMLSFLLTLATAAASPAQLTAQEPLMLFRVPVGEDLNQVRQAMPALDDSSIVQQVELHEPLPGVGPTALVSDGAMALYQGRLLELEQLWLPTEQVELAQASLQGRLAQGPWEIQACGSGCEHWSGEPGSLTVLAQSGGVQLLFTPGVTLDADAHRALVADPPGVERTPARVALDDADWGVLMRFGALQRHQVLWNTQQAELATDRASLGRRQTLWLGGAAEALDDLALSDPGGAEFVDMAVLATDRGPRLVATLSELGAQARQGRRGAKLPAWTGPTPDTELVYVGQLDAALSRALPGVEGSRDLQRLARSGSAGLALYARPWALVRLLLEDSRPGIADAQLGIRAVRLVVTGEQRQRSLAVLCGSEEQAQALVQRVEEDGGSQVARRGATVLISAAGDPEQLFGVPSREPAGLRLDLGEYPMPLPAGLGDPLQQQLFASSLNARVVGGALVVDGQSGRGAWLPPTGRAQGSPGPQVCLQGLEVAPQLQAHAREPDAALLTQLVDQALPGVQACAQRWPTDPAIGVALSTLHTLRGVQALQRGDVPAARPDLVAACEQGRSFACALAAEYPVTLPAELPRVELGAAELPLGGDVASLVEEQLMFGQLRSCPAADANCITATASELGGERDHQLLYAPGALGYAQLLPALTALHDAGWQDLRLAVTADQPGLHGLPLPLAKPPAGLIADGVLHPLVDDEQGLYAFPLELSPLGWTLWQEEETLQGETPAQLVEALAELAGRHPDAQLYLAVDSLILSDLGPFLGALNAFQQGKDIEISLLY